MSPEERGLFKERIKNLDKRMQHGFNKLTWAKVQAADEYISNCKRHSGELQIVQSNLDLKQHMKFLEKMNQQKYKHNGQDLLSVCIKCLKKRSVSIQRIHY